MASEALSPEAEALLDLIGDTIDQGVIEYKSTRWITTSVARVVVRELRLAEPEIHVPNALAHKLLPLLELAGESP